MAQFQIKYVGTALPGNVEVVTLFDTVASGWGANAFSTLEVSRIYVALVNSQAGTLKEYKSLDRGVTWTQIDPDRAVAAVAANSENGYDYLVAPYQDWKLTWTNGATPQTLFSASIAATDQRVIGN